MLDTSLEWMVILRPILVRNKEHSQPTPAHLVQRDYGLDPLFSDYRNGPLFSDYWNGRRGQWMRETRETQYETPPSFIKHCSLAWQDALCYHLRFYRCLTYSSWWSYYWNVDDARAKCLKGIDLMAKHPKECHRKADMINRACVNRFPKSNAELRRIKGQRCFEKARYTCHWYCGDRDHQCVQDRRECEEERKLQWDQCIKNSPCHKKLLSQKTKHTSYLSQMGETEYYLKFVIPYCFVPEKNNQVSKP